MLDKVKKLHRLRRAKAGLAEELRQSRQDWEDENAYTLSTLNDIGDEIALLTSQLKNDRIQLYDGEDKSKTFGVGIREETRLRYDVGLAYQWALDHKLCLRLDVKAFEKIAKAGMTTIEFMATTTVVTATIAADLSEWLEAEPDE